MNGYGLLIVVGLAFVVVWLLTRLRAVTDQRDRLRVRLLQSSDAVADTLRDRAVRPF